MNGDYQISNDGTIFEIKDDGSISKLGQIKGGKIVGVSNNNSNNNNNNNNNDETILSIVSFLIVLLLAVVFVLFFMYRGKANTLTSMREECDSYKTQYENAQEELSSARNKYEKRIIEEHKKYSDLNKEYSELKNSPLYINNIEIANITDDGTVETDYGYTIYSRNTMFLHPRISYVGIYSGYRTLKVKWYDSNDYLSTGTSSPTGFSQQQYVFIYEGKNQFALAGWGSSNKGYWSAGTYKIEIWYGNVCLKSKSFTIY